MQDQALLPPEQGSSYTRWIGRFLRFHREAAGLSIHPRKMSADHLEPFLTHLAVRRRVAASSRNQALNAIVFLFRDVSGVQLGESDAVRAKRPVRLPTVLPEDKADGRAVRRDDRPPVPFGRWYAEEAEVHVGIPPSAADMIRTQPSLDERQVIGGEIAKVYAHSSASPRARTVQSTLADPLSASSGGASPRSCLPALHETTTG